MKEYDLIVVGSGVGLTVLSQALNQGWDCALIERSKMGGTCLTKGCIPSKVLVYPADLIRESQHGTSVGIKIKIEDVNWDKISKRMWSQINESEDINKGLSQAPNLTIYRGLGEFTGKYTMKVKYNKNSKYSEEFKGKRIVLASGGRSAIPPIKNIENVSYITSENFFGQKFPKKPWKSLIIVGGGIIAAEFAHIFSAIGTKVTIIEMLPRLVSTEEPEISRILEEEFSHNLKVLTNTKAIELTRSDDKKILKVENVKTGDTHKLEAHEILIAAGRRSNADLLKVEKAGIETDEKNWIKTNQYLETNVKNIWAIGDANGKYQFRHKANHDAEICVQNIFGSGKKQAVDYSAVPWAIFTYPQIAHVGMTEQEALDAGHKIYRAVKPYNSVAKGFAMGLDEKEFFFKLVVDESYRILGAHAIGPSAALLIQQIVYLMNAGFSCPDQEQDINISSDLSKAGRACPAAGSFMPIYESMVIHPSLNEVAGWALGNLHPVNIEHRHHHH